MEALEIWKPVKGWKNFYEASNLGRVRSLDRAMVCFGSMFIKEGRILSPSTNHQGYQSVILSKTTKRKCCFVHRLVAIAFIPNPQRKPEVNHIEGNKADNRATSLEWVTESENIYHSWSSGLRRQTA